MQKQLIGMGERGGGHMSCCYFSFRVSAKLPPPTLPPLAALLSKCSDNVVHSSIQQIFTEHLP